MKSVRKVVRCPGKRPPEKPYGVDQTEERRGKEERREEGKGRRDLERKDWATAMEVAKQSKVELKRSLGAWS